MKQPTTRNIYTLDLGNSHPSVGEFQDGELKSVTPLSVFLESSPCSLSDPKFIASEVRGHLPQDFREKFKPLDPMTHFKSGYFFDMPVDYAMTLGPDRLIQSYYLYKENLQSSLPWKNLGLIDSGTFTTLDIISPEGFQGGYILPGLDLLCKTYDRGEKLPALSLAQLKDFFMRRHERPKNTLHAMGLGIWNLLEGHYGQWIKDNRLEKIIVTGGNGEIVFHLLREILSSFGGNQIEIEFSPHLIHHSLWQVGQMEEMHITCNDSDEGTLCPTY